MVTIPNIGILKRNRGDSTFKIDFLFMEIYGAIKLLMIPSQEKLKILIGLDAK